MVEFTVKCLPGGAWEYPDEWPQCLPCKSELLAKSVHFRNLPMFQPSTVRSLQRSLAQGPGSGMEVLNTRQRSATPVAHMETLPGSHLLCFTIVQILLTLSYSAKGMEDSMKNQWRSVAGTRLGFRALSTPVLPPRVNRFPSHPSGSGSCTPRTRRTTSPSPPSSPSTTPRCRWWWSSRGGSSARKTSSKCCWLEGCLCSSEKSLNWSFGATELMKRSTFGLIWMQSRKSQICFYNSNPGLSNPGQTDKIELSEIWESLATEPQLDGTNPLWSGFHQSFLVKTNHLVRISCDSDGWVMSCNKERSYPTFLHIIQPVEIKDIQVPGFCAKIQNPHLLSSLRFLVIWRLVISGLVTKVSSQQR